MNWNHPQYLGLLVLMIPLAMLVGYGFYRIHSRMKGFADLLPGLKISKGSLYLRGILWALALLLIFVAMAGPRWGFRWQQVKVAGSDVLVAVDVSLSVLAEDISPSRLERARRKLRDLLPMLGPSRVGLIAFAGGAFVMCPLTSDKSALEMFIDRLDPELIGSQGTDLTSVLSIAKNSFEHARPNESAAASLLILSDGEDLVSPPGFFGKSAETPFKVFALIIGSEDGAPIPLPQGGFKKDRSGQVVTTKADHKPLAALTESSQGHWVWSKPSDQDLWQLIDQGLIPEASEEQELSEAKKVYYQRYPWFVLWAALLLVIETFVAIWPRRWPTGKGAPIAPVAAFVVLAGSLLVAAPRVQAQDIDPEISSYNQGVEFYQQQDFAAAIEAFTAASQSADMNVRHQALFNLANAWAHAQKLDEAIGVLEEILEAKPDDRPSQENLAYLRQLKEQQQDQRQDDQQKDDQQKEQDSDQEQQDQKNDQQNGDPQKGQDQQQDQKNEQQKGQDQQQPQQQEQDGPSEEEQSGDEQKPFDEEQSPQPSEQDKGGDEQQSEQENSLGDDRQQKADADHEQGKTAQAGSEQEQQLEQRSISDAELQRLLRQVEDQGGRYLLVPEEIRRQPRQGEKDW